MSDRHRFFLGESFQSNVRDIEARVPGDWRVYCGHCGVALAGSSGRGGARQDIIWSHRGGSWFGSFIINKAGTASSGAVFSAPVAGGSLPNTPAHPTEQKP